MNRAEFSSEERGLTTRLKMGFARCIYLFKICFGLAFIMWPVLILGLDYHPYTTLILIDGYCTNNRVIKSSDVYIYYTSDVYTKINGTFIGVSNGCTGTRINSFKQHVWYKNSFNAYPYESVDGNVPTWLCSYEPLTSWFWDDVGKLNNHNKSDITEYVFGGDPWTECRYTSLDYIKKHWNKQSIAQTGSYEYMSVINVHNSSYKNIKRTQHYYCMLMLMLIFSVTIPIMIFNLVCNPEQLPYDD